MNSHRISTMKQTTLFSLKSWKKIVVEDILKYKDILDNQDTAEGTLLKILNSLKKKNPTKDVVLSNGIDLTLKTLEKHSSTRVSGEARMLIKYWKLDNFKIQPTNAMERYSTLEIHNIQSSTKIGKQQTDEMCKLKQPIGVIKNYPAIENYKTQSDHHAMDIHQTNLINHASEKNNIPSTPTQQQINGLCKTKPVNQVYKKAAANEAKRRNITRRLQMAMQLFIEELGEQEVKTYLNTHV